MHNRSPVSSPCARLLPALPIAVTLLVAGCFGGSGRQDRPAESQATLDAPLDLSMPPMSITLDGAIDDWPLEAAAVADEHYLYLRFKTEREVSLMADEESVQIQLDTDASASTGRETAGMGVDLAVTFSARDAGNERGQGAHVDAISRSRDSVRLPAAALDLSVAPTHAARWFELRIGRRLDAADGVLPPGGLLGAGRVRGRVVLLGGDGRLLAAADPFDLTVIPAGSRPRLGSEVVPDKSLGSVRLLSYNVENSAPDRNPAPFSRMLRAIDPDIVLVQEWYDQTPETLAAWFNRELPIDGRWAAVTSTGRGVAVISRLDIKPLGPAGVTIDDGGEARTVRSASALVDTPAGPIAVTSVHLKCCGSIGSSEDQLRRLEALGITTMLADALSGIGSHGRVIAGDYNLVGGLAPLEAMLGGMDADGSDLELAEPFVMADPAMYTWSSPQSEFLPGRLDYAAYSGSTLAVERAFVLDPARLGPASLDAMNLDPGDAAASDHRPLVIDLRAP